jgi:hypothetical protein
VIEFKIGALCWNQYTDWPSLLEAGSGRTSWTMKRTGPEIAATRLKLRGTFSTTPAPVRDRRGHRV